MLNWVSVVTNELVADSAQAGLKHSNMALGDGAQRSNREFAFPCKFHVFSHLV